MATKKKTGPGFKLAIERAVEIAGSARALARDTVPPLTHTTIRNFRRLTDRPPRPLHVISVEAATKGRVDRMEFYPEIMSGPLGKRLGKFLKQYAKEDEEVKALVADLRQRGISM